MNLSKKKKQPHWIFKVLFNQQSSTLAGLEGRPYRIFHRHTNWNTGTEGVQNVIKWDLGKKNISISVSIFCISSFLLALVQKSWYSRWYSADMCQFWWLKYLLSGWQTAIASSTLHILHLSHYLPQDLSMMWQPNG